jgi:hypothetical protein
MGVLWLPQGDGPQRDCGVDCHEGFYRPGGTVLLTAKGKGERIIAFAWPDPGHKAVEGKRME